MSCQASFDHAVLAHRRGQLTEAEQVYRRILQNEANHAGALHLLGVIRHQQGDYEAAIQLIGRAIALDPHNAVYCNNYGLPLHALGRFAEALDSFRRALEINPHYAQALANLGMAQQSLGQHKAAMASYREALELEPYHADALSKLARLLEELGHAEEAIRLYEDGISHAPCLQFYVNLGALRISTGRADMAVGLLRKATELAPNCATAHLNFGMAQGELTKDADALPSFRKAIELQPRNPDILGRFAALLKKLGRAGEAVPTYERALAERPTAETHLGYGELLFGLGQRDRAIDQYRRAIELAPELADAHFSLGNALKDQGKIEEAAAHYARAVELKPDSATMHSNFLFCEQYRANVTPAELAAAHAEWDRRHAAPLRAAWRPFSHDRDPHRPLRLGFVSGNFRHHPVGFLTIRAIEALKHLPSPTVPLPEGEGSDACEVVCYSDVSRPDGITERFTAAADRWLDVGGLSDEALSEQIRSDRVDVLFDLGGHSGGQLGGNRLLVFARKPAPIQVKWVGYPGSSGLTSMDYLLADRWQVEAGGEAYCPEKILRLPDGYVCFDPPAGAPEVGPLPALALGHVTFGSFNNPAKITPRVVATWAEVLRRVPGSRLVLKYRGFGERGVRQYYEELLAASGIGPERLELLGWSPRGRMLAEYNRTDIALDPFPYSGGITTCEALWMGVPVITLPGKTFAGRHSLSHLSNVGLTETVARDVADYVELAVGLAHDLPRLAKWRAELRGQVARSPLCDGPRFAANLMTALRSISQEWIATGPVVP